MTTRPGYASRSGWNAVARNCVNGLRLEQDIRAKYLIVGAGYAGLAAARRLAELHPDETVVVLDALPPAENASGRNSGFMIDLPYAKIDARSSPDQADWQIALLQAGLRTLKEQVDAHGIECGWAQHGHYKAATTEFGQGALREVQAVLRSNQVPFRVLDAGAIQAELGSQFYRAAIWLPSCTLVQPAELVNGLVRTLPPNVQIFFNTPVESISSHSPYVVAANGREIRAEFVLLCVNTDLPAFGRARYRQLTMYTYAGLSRELSPAEAAAFGAGDDWGVTPVERLEATSRKIAGKRVMFRAGFSYKREAPLEEVRRDLSRVVSVRYPALGRDLLEHVWAGAVSLTRNGDPIFERYGEKLYGVSGCNASGILKMTALGTLLADAMLGVPSGLLESTRRHSHPSFIPPDPIRRMAVNLNIRKLKRELGDTGKRDAGKHTSTRTS